MEKKIILSAYDFTERGKIALKHAFLIGKTIRSNIRLIHVVNYTADIHTKQNELNKIAEDFNKNYPHLIDSIVVKGDITSAINRYADNIGAIIAIIGSSGSFHGLERIFGNRTLKIIRGSITPFIVVQKPPVRDTVKNIVFPINFKKENKEKLLWAKFLHRFNNVKILMFVKHQESRSVLTKVNANLLFAKKYLNRHYINYKIALAKGENEFYKELTDFSQASEADLIMIMASKNLDFADYIIGTTEQNIISNKAKIPVMCINPRIDLVRYRSFF